MSEQSSNDYPSNNAIVAFLAVLGIFIVAVLAGWVYTNRQFAVILGAAWIFVGIQMPKSRPNWLFGVRVRWTLEDPVVWQEVHHVAGRVFVGLGALTLLVALVDGSAALAVVITGTLVATLPILWYARHRYQARHGVPTRR
jgi:uncharacterized membrane protein